MQGDESGLTDHSRRQHMILIIYPGDAHAWMSGHVSMRRLGVDVAAPKSRRSRFECWGFNIGDSGLNLKEHAIVSHAQGLSESVRSRSPESVKSRSSKI